MNDFCWRKVKEQSEYQEMLEEILELHREKCQVEERVLPYSKYKEFKETGNRANFEREYFDRRLRLAIRTIMYLIYEKEEDLAAVQDIVWAICGEYAWAIPAHISHEEEDSGRVTFVDLFASETGYLLSEVYCRLKDVLDEEMKQRIRYEVERRVINPFLNRRFWWEEARHNWASVCAGYVGGTFLNLFSERFDLVKGRLQAAMESFLSGFQEDGACMEGVSYWNYGFGMFCFYYELLSKRDPGALDIFQREKVRNIAMFYQSACLDGGIAVTFADCQPNALYSMELMFFLKRIYGDAIRIPPLKYRIRMFKKGLSGMLRSFEQYDPALLCQDIETFEHYFEQSQLFSCKKKHYSFAAKGGHNDEPHNHNDIGSFLFVKGGRQILCDIGVGVYTKEYFAAQTRYQLLGNGSQGHSVPILDGQYQCAGKQYAASEVSFADGCLSMNLLGAYGREGSLVRKFFIGDEGVTLTDAYQLAWTPKSIVERFVAYECPMVEEGKLVWRDTQMTFDQEQLECKITKQQYQNNFKGIFDVWLIDFVLKENNPEQTVRFEIRSMQ